MTRLSQLRAAPLLAAVGIATAAIATGITPDVSMARAPATHPASGLAVIPLTVGEGRHAHRFRVELARTGAEQAQGLMFRKALGADEGMIFPMEPPRYASFWMHNTLIPLDIVFIGTDGRILSIAPRATPLSDAQILSGGIAKAVLELNGGRAAALGLGIGEKVSWRQ